MASMSRRRRTLSDPRFTQPWHGVPREQIDWAPTIEPELCNGCGLCVTSCGRAVFRYDYENRMAVVTESFQCMVGCVTCANTCPTDAFNLEARGVNASVRVLEPGAKERFTIRVRRTPGGPTAGS